MIKKFNDFVIYLILFLNVLKFGDLNIDIYEGVFYYLVISVGKFIFYLVVRNSIMWI